MNADYVDFVVRGQGEDTFLQWVNGCRGRKDYSAIRGLSYKENSGRHIHNPERPMRNPADFPSPPFHRLDASKYVLPTFLGSRTAVHQAGLGCPFPCNFCGVVPAFGRIQKMEPPLRTASVLELLNGRYGVNAIQFYDNNFFLREDDARELADRIASLELRWWCEGRVDTVLDYSDETLRALRRAGLTMAFFGAESGSDWVLKEMQKGIRAEQTLALARRIRKFDIVPEFSFILGNPHDLERDCRESIAFIREIKKLNPDAEIIVQHYIPTPQRDGMYGGIDDRIQFPETPEEWATARWYNFTIRTDPHLPWLPERLRRLVDDFELVVQSRWPTKQDIHLSPTGRMILQMLSSWRYAFQVYSSPSELRWARALLAPRNPKVESV